MRKNVRGLLFFEKAGRLAKEFFKVVRTLKRNNCRTPVFKKVWLFLLYIKFTAKDCIFVRILKHALKNEKFFGYNIVFPDYSTFRFLFVEIFIWQEYYFKSDKPNPLIFDCGASIGMATLFFKFLYPKSRIIAFEPNPEAFYFLEKNIKSNLLEGVEAHNIALLDREDEIEFNLYKANILWSSVVKLEAVFSRQVKVRSSILSKFVNEKVDFLKMDIEGSEYKVVEELVKKEKLKMVKELVIEYHNNIDKNAISLLEFLKYLKNENFNCLVSGPSNPVSSEGQPEFFLVQAVRDDK